MQGRVRDRGSPRRAPPQMCAARTGRARADAEPPGELGLPGRSQRRAFLVSDTDPFNLALPDGIREGIEGIANQTENLCDADLFEHTDQKLRYRPRHLLLPNNLIDTSAEGTKPAFRKGRILGRPNLGPARICSKLRFGDREHGARQLNWRELVLARLASPLISSSELLIGPCATEFAIGIDNV